MSAIAAHLKLRTTASQRRHADTQTRRHADNESRLTRALTRSVIGTAMMVDGIVNRVNHDIAGLALAANSL